MAEGGENGPMTVRLQPAGTITGRLVDEEGRPRTGVAINVGYGPGQFTDIPYFFTLLEPALGNDGRFRIEGLIPGVVYELNFRVGADTYLGESAKGLETSAWRNS